MNYIKCLDKECLACEFMGPAEAYYNIPLRNEDGVPSGKTLQMKASKAEQIGLVKDGKIVSNDIRIKS